MSSSPRFVFRSENWSESIERAGLREESIMHFAVTQQCHYNVGEQSNAHAGVSLFRSHRLHLKLHKAGAMTMSRAFCDTRARARKSCAVTAFFHERLEIFRGNFPQLAFLIYMEIHARGAVHRTAAIEGRQFMKNARRFRGNSWRRTVSEYQWWTKCFIHCQPLITSRCKLNFRIYERGGGREKEEKASAQFLHGY